MLEVEGRRGTCKEEDASGEQEGREEWKRFMRARMRGRGALMGGEGGRGEWVEEG